MYVILKLSKYTVLLCRREKNILWFTINRFTRKVRLPKKLFLNLGRAGLSFKKRRLYFFFFLRDLGLSKQWYWVESVLACDTASSGIAQRFDGSQCLRLRDQRADEEQMFGKMSVMYSTKDTTPHLSKSESSVCELNLNILTYSLHGAESFLRS